MIRSQVPNLYISMRSKQIQGSRLPGLVRFSDTFPRFDHKRTDNQNSGSVCCSSSFNLVWHCSRREYQRDVELYIFAVVARCEAYPLQLSIVLKTGSRPVVSRQFKAARSDGKPVQVEAALTFAFSTSLDRHQHLNSGAIPPSMLLLRNPIKVLADRNSLRTRLCSCLSTDCSRERCRVALPRLFLAQNGRS